MLEALNDLQYMMYWKKEKRKENTGQYKELDDDTFLIFSYKSL